MNTEMMAVPADKVGEVVRVIRLGINRARQIKMPISDETIDNLHAWCREQDIRNAKPRKGGK